MDWDNHSDFIKTASSQLNHIKSRTGGSMLVSIKIFHWEG